MVVHDWLYAYIYCDLRKVGSISTSEQTKRTRKLFKLAFS